MSWNRKGGKGMHSLSMPVKRGLSKSLNLLWLFCKVILPITFCLVFLEHLGWVQSFARVLAPFMRFLGLPGEAAIPLLLGFFINTYAAVGALIAIPMTAGEITILATMVLISHALFVETAICKQAGLNWWAAFSLRIITALVAGVVMNLMYIVLGRIG